LNEVHIFWYSVDTLHDTRLVKNETIPEMPKPWGGGLVSLQIL
jgi:hypothetical protein